MKRMNQEWCSPFGEYICASEFREFNAPLEDLAVLSYSPDFKFPWRSALRSIRMSNPTLENYLIFIDARSPADVVEDIHLILGDKKVYILHCFPNESWREGNHPKSCTYMAALFLPAKVYVFLDLDMIVSSDLTFKMRACRDNCQLRYVPENLSSNPCDLWHHCFQDGGIYHGTLDDSYRVGYVKELYDTDHKLVNTGLMMGSYYVFAKIAATLLDISYTGEAKEWVHEQIPGVFTAHREQAMFDLAFRLAKLPYVELNHAWNYQALTMPTPEVLPSVLHFNGYHNPETPSRKLFDSLLASDSKFRQLCGL